MDMPESSATSRSRRSLLAAAVGLATGSAGGARTSARGCTPDATTTADASEKIFTMFVQTAQGGHFMPKPGEDGVYQVVLRGTSAHTVYFSDRPHRIVGSVSTADFLAGLGFTEENPPNAAIVTQTDEGDDVIVVELLNPQWDIDSQTLTYDVRVLDEYQGDGFGDLAQRQDDGVLPETFGHTSLFIDDCPDLTVCVNDFDGSNDNKPFKAPLPGGPVKQHYGHFGGCVPVGDHYKSYYADLCSRHYPRNCPNMIAYSACDPR